MNKINVGILDEHKLVQEGLSAILLESSDIEVVLLACDKADLVEKMKTTLVHVLVINIHSLTTQQINLIMQINLLFPKIKTLIFSVFNDEDTVLKTIKAGAKGFLAKESSKSELVEAIYTLRNGFDFFSKSITHILLNKYITKLKCEDNENLLDLKNLSSREIEILKLWGGSFNNKEISDKLFISVRTVESHKNHIMQKLNLKTTVDLVKFAIKNNIIEI